MKTGGHIKPCKVGQVELHNRRDPDYVERMAKSKHPLHFYPHLACRANVDEYSNDYADYHCVKDIFDAMIVRYQEMDKRHRKPPLKDRERIDKKTGKKVVVSGWSPIREMVVVIKSDTTVEQLHKFSEWMKAEKGVNTIFTSLHFDEGHIGKKDNKFHCNFHAHVGLDFFNWETGKTIKLDKKDMSDIQTALAECLGMERGEIKEITEKEHLDVVEFRLKAEEDAILQEHQDRIERNAKKVQESEKEVEQMEAKKAELQQHVGAGAKIAAFFGIGELAEIRKELQEREVAHAEELVSEKKKSRQEGYREAISAVKESAKLYVKGDNDTAEDIGKAWRNAFNERKEAKEKVKQLEEEAKSRSKESTNAAASLAIEKRKAENAVADTLERVNKVMFRVGNGRFSENDLAKCEEIEKTLGSSMPWSYKDAKNNLCRSIRAWAELKWDGKKSPDALALLKKLFIAMKEAFRKLLALVGSSPERQQAAIDDVRLQLKFSPGIEEHEWDEAVKQSADEYIASYCRAEQYNVEKIQVEEVSRSHSWQR